MNLTNFLKLFKVTPTDGRWDNYVNQNFDTIDTEIQNVKDGNIPVIHANDVQTDKITLPDGTITSAQNIGGTAQTLAQAMALGKEADLQGVDFALTDAGRDLIRVDAHKGLAGMVGNIMTPLVHIPMKRANDAVALSGVETFTRATAATYIDPITKLRKQATVDTPRFELAPNGQIMLKHEGASTNVVPTSINMASNWIFASVVTPTHNNLDAWGNNAATALIKSATTNASSLAYVSLTLPTNSPITISFDAKPIAAGAKIALHWAGNESFTVNACDIVNGTNQSGFASKSEPIGNGYYRFEVTIPSNLGGTGSLSFYHELFASTTGNGVDGNDISSIQVEGMPFATSYIDNAGTSPATRAADYYRINTAGNMGDQLNNITVAIDYYLDGDTNAPQQLFSTGADFRGFGSAASSFHCGGATTSPFTVNNSVNRAVFTSDGNTIKAYLNQQLHSSVAAVNNAITNNTTIEFGSTNNGTVYQLYGYIGNLRIWDKSFNDMEAGAA